MKIGIPKEIKDNEYRVAATPSMVQALTALGHQVFVEKDAGLQIGLTDEMFREAGAVVESSSSRIYQSEMIIKVKEPQESEFSLLHEGQILFCYLHLAPDPRQTEQLLKKKVIAIAYETVTDSKGKLPLLIPMSEMAGRIAIQAGATCLQLNYGGKGLLLGGVPGVLPANVLVIGGGVVGTEAARKALGAGANVTIMDKNLERLRELDALFGPSLKTVYSTPSTIEDLIVEADLVVGAVLIPGKTAPKLITDKMLQKMTPGSVLVDVAIDQGGCAESSRPTSHSNPTYNVHGVVHYCVTNMPGACARTSTYALTNATMEYAIKIAQLGYKKALIADPGLKEGLNLCLGHVTNREVAADLGYRYVDPETFLID